MKVLDLRFKLGLPYGRFKHLGAISGPLFAYKAWELEHYYYTGSVLDLDCNITTQQDHAGLDISVCVLGYSIHFSVYDIRHCDHNNNF